MKTHGKEKGRLADGIDRMTDCVTRVAQSE